MPLTAAEQTLASTGFFMAEADFNRNRKLRAVAPALLLLGTGSQQSGPTTKPPDEGDSAAGSHARQQTDAVRPLHPSLG